MRKTFFLVNSLLLSSSLLFAQPKKFIPSVGVEFNLLLESNNAVGGGFHFREEHFFSQNFSASLTVGYIRFKGDIVYWDGSKDKTFSLIPVLLGGKYFIHKFYGGFEGGLAIKASSNVSTLPAVSPSVGILLNKLDISCKLLSVLQMPSIPENTFLQRGGYSYIGVRIAYHLN